MPLSDHVTAGPADRAMAWLMPRIRAWSWFPDYFSAAGVIRVIHIDSDSTANVDLLQVGAVRIESEESVSQVSYDRMFISFGYLFEVAELAVDDAAITYTTVTDEIGRFLWYRPPGEASHSTLGFAEGVTLSTHRVIALPVEAESRHLRVIAIVEAEYRLDRDLLSQEIP